MRTDSEESKEKQETEEADALLKEETDQGKAKDESEGSISLDLSLHDTYELSFSNNVDVFKKS